MSTWKKVNKELLLVLSMFVIAALLNFVVASHRMILGFYMLPTLFSAYLYGRRHATLTALASALLVGLLMYFNPVILRAGATAVGLDAWFDFAIWAGSLIVIAYVTGTLYERQEAHLRELRASYDGILLILQNMAGDNKYSTNHPYRVSVCATRIAEAMELSAGHVEDVRSAALIHDVGLLGISRDLLFKAANLTEEEYEQARREGISASQKGGSLRRAILILLTYNDLCADKSPERLSKSPMEARILQVADAYDSIASDRSAPKSPLEAVQLIRKRSGVDLDSRVVDAFLYSLGGSAVEAASTA